MMPLTRCLIQTERTCAQQLRRHSCALWTQSKRLPQARFNAVSRSAILQQSIPRAPHLVAHSFSTAADEPTHQSTASSHNNNNNDGSMDSARRDILQAALTQVHEFGWSEDAIAAAVISKGLPITMTGLVNTSDLISHAMKTANEQFRTELEQTLVPRWTANPAAAATGPSTPLPDRLAEAIQARLTLILPFVQSHKWHDGMALGAMPYNIMTTQAQLHGMIRDLSQAVTTGESIISWGPLEQAAIGAVYVATELHLLTDTSVEYTDTWSFLRQRVSELDMLTNVTRTTTDTFGGVFPVGGSSTRNGGIHHQVEDVMLVASAVASSLAGAVVSLTLSSPSSIKAVRNTAETAASMVPTWVQQVLPIPTTNYTAGSTVRQPDGTQPGDYDIVTPFPPDNYTPTEGTLDQQVLATASVK